MYLVLTCMPRDSYRRRLRSLLLYLCDVFRALINSLVCWFCTSALGLVLFQICYSGINVTSSLLLLVFVVFPTYSQLSVRKRSSSPNSVIPKQCTDYHATNSALHPISLFCFRVMLRVKSFPGVCFYIYIYCDAIEWETLDTRKRDVQAHYFRLSAFRRGNETNRQIGFQCR